MSQFGLPVTVVSAVGADDLGREIIENISGKGLNHLIEQVPYPTGTVLVQKDETGNPHYDIRQNVAWDNIPFTERLEQLAARTRAVCFGSLAQRGGVTRQTISRFLDAMPRTPDTLVIFDVNLRQNFYDKQILAGSMQRCNILKINNEELDVISRLFGLEGLEEQEQCRALMRKYDLKMLILTCGADGSYVFTPGEVSFRPVHKVKVADAVGAGDSFTAAFIASILKGRSIAEAHDAAARTSAFVCSCPGAMPLLPADLTGCPAR